MSQPAIPFRQRMGDSMRGHTPLVGTTITLPVPELVEIAVGSGFDWLWLDMEHGLLDVADVQRAAMAAHGTPCLARVPVNNESWIKRALDTGVDGLIIPQVNTPELAERAARFTRYPPLGVRSVGAGRAHGYGKDFDSYNARANNDLALIVQIEHVQAVENLDAILHVTGIDAIIVGPYDLSTSMGKPGQLDDPTIRATIAYILAACKRRLLPAGIYCPDQAAALRAIQEGFTLITAATDVSVLRGAWNGLRSGL